MVDIDWYGDEDTTNRILVRSTGVKFETLLIANWIGAIAHTRLAAHHANNIDDPRPDSSISVSRGTVDAFVNLDDPDGGAMAIAKLLGIFSPYGFDGTGARPKSSKKRKKKLRKGYGKQK